MKDLTNFKNHHQERKTLLLQQHTTDKVNTEVGLETTHRQTQTLYTHTQLDAYMHTPTNPHTLRGKGK